MEFSGWGRGAEKMTKENRHMNEVTEEPTSTKGKKDVEIWGVG